MGSAVARSDGVLCDALAARSLSPETDPELVAALAALRAVAGENLEAVVFFGSRRTGAARADSFSAYDLLAVVQSYRPFYRALRAAGLLGKSPRLLAFVSRFLPPTQISLRLASPELHAKLSVIERQAFVRETSRGRRDHFTIGRLFQPVRLVFACNEAARAVVLAALSSALVETWRWARPWLPPAFDAETYGRRALEVSLSWEIRPEPAGRAAALWSAQREEQTPVFAALLAELERLAEVRRIAEDPSRFAAVHGASAWERLRLRGYFVVSLARATARWGKHVVSFDGWLDYIVHKASRHSGETIELSARERRWPLVFMWARVFRYLRRKRSGVRDGRGRPGGTRP